MDVLSLLWYDCMIDSWYNITECMRLWWLQGNGQSLVTALTFHARSPFYCSGHNRDLRITIDHLRCQATTAFHIGKKYVFCGLLLVIGIF